MIIGKNKKRKIPININKKNDRNKKLKRKIFLISLMFNEQTYNKIKSFLLLFVNIYLFIKIYYTKAVFRLNFYLALLW
jgi:hypothetical protein